MSLLKRLKKLTYLEIILLFLIIALLIGFCKPNIEPFVEEKGDLIIKSGNDIFDSFYANIYDDLLHSKEKDDFEVNYILSNLKSKPIILDIGSGTGHHVDLFNKSNASVIGIDKSLAMINIAKKNYPELDFRKGNVLNSMEFAENTFTHITCLYFTIYYIKDKQQFFENCYKWLKPHGVLILHLVNIHKFDPLLIDSEPIKNKNHDNAERITEGIIKFDIFDYKSQFKLDKNQDANLLLKQPNVTFKETIKFNDSKNIRINEHNLYMPNQKTILTTARDVGFILQSQTSMENIGFDHQYLYTLQKPS